MWPWYVAPIWAIEKVAGKMQLLLTATVRMLRCSEGGLGFISHYHSLKSCQYVHNEGDLCAESLRSNDNLRRTRYHANCPARCWSNSCLGPTVRNYSISHPILWTYTFIHTYEYKREIEVSHNKLSPCCVWFLLIVPTPSHFFKTVVCFII